MIIVNSFCAGFLFVFIFINYMDGYKKEAIFDIVFTVLNLLCAINSYIGD